MHSSMRCVSTGHCHHTLCQYRTSHIQFVAAHPVLVPDIAHKPGSSIPFDSAYQGIALNGRSLEDAEL
eukprot:3941830-Rhodomonas_salina.2